MNRRALFGKIAAAAAVAAVGPAATSVEATPSERPIDTRSWTLGYDAAEGLAYRRGLADANDLPMATPVNAGIIIEPSSFAGRQPFAVGVQNGGAMTVTDDLTVTGNVTLGAGGTSTPDQIQQIVDILTGKAPAPEIRLTGAGGTLTDFSEPPEIIVGRAFGQDVWARNPRYVEPPTYEAMQADCAARGCALGRATRGARVVYGHARLRVEGISYAYEDYAHPDLARVDAWRRSLHGEG